MSTTSASKQTASVDTEWNFEEELAKVRQQLINEALEDGALRSGTRVVSYCPLRLRKIRKVRKNADGTKTKTDTGRRVITLSKKADFREWGAYKGLQFQSEEKAVEFINKAVALWKELKNRESELNED